MAEHLARAVQSLYPTLETNSDYSAIISERHRERLTALVDDAREQGASIISGPIKSSTAEGASVA